MSASVPALNPESWKVDPGMVYYNIQSKYHTSRDRIYTGIYRNGTVEDN